jgi:hypothetical protein
MADEATDSAFELDENLEFQRRQLVAARIAVPASSSSSRSADRAVRVRVMYAVLERDGQISIIPR